MGYKNEIKNTVDEYQKLVKDLVSFIKETHETLTSVVENIRQSVHYVSEIDVKQSIDSIENFSNNLADLLTPSNITESILETNKKIIKDLNDALHNRNK